MTSEMRFDRAIEESRDQVIAELYDSISLHGDFASAHEAHSVIREEFEELWDHVKADTGYSDEAFNEAKQLAAMAIKYMVMVLTEGDVTA